MERNVPGEDPGSFDEPGQVSPETSADAAGPDEWTVQDFDQFEAFDVDDDRPASFGAGDDRDEDVPAASPEAPDLQPPDEGADVEQPPLDLGFGQTPIAPPPPAPELEPPPEPVVPSEPDWSAVVAPADDESADDFAAIWEETSDDSAPSTPAWDTPRPADQLQEIPVIVPPTTPATPAPPQTPLPAASEGSTPTDSGDSAQAAPRDTKPAESAPSDESPPAPGDQSEPTLPGELPSAPGDQPEPPPDEPSPAPGGEPESAESDGASVPDGPAAFVPEDWDDDADSIPDFAQFTSEEYVQATTQEYAGLAADVARAAEEPHEQMAVSADIPGIESGTVGLEDVVAASGDDSETIQAPRASDLPLRVLTAVGLIVIFLGSLYQPYLIGTLILIVLGLAAGEIYTVLIRAGHHPLAIFGFVGVAGAMIGTWIWEPVAIPTAILITLVATLLFYGVVPDRSRPLHNTSLTMLGVLWIGGLGGFAFDIIKSEYYGWLVAALVVTVAVMDIGQYFVGRRIGKRALAPVVSPKKTVEGLVGGVLVALLVGVGFSYFGPFDLGSGLLIGAVVAVVAPIGDLAVSVIKRAIGVKDMSSILPGHGGILDRIDAMIFTIPAMWIAYSWLGLLA